MCIRDRYDITSPDLIVSGVPWISNSQTLEISIQTEPGASLTFDGTILTTNEFGIANHTLELDESQMGVSPEAQGGNTFYYNSDSNVFTIESSDNAGNSATASFQVVFDPDPPSEVSLLSIIDQAGFSYGLEELADPVNITSGTAIFEIPADAMEWCVLVLYESWVQTSECLDDAQVPSILNETTGFPIPGSNEYPSKEHISVPLELSGLGEGSLTLSLSITDWASNTFDHTWGITLDSKPPVVSWSLSPSTCLLYTSPSPRDRG